MINIEKIRKELTRHIKSISSDELLEELKEAGLIDYPYYENFINEDIEMHFSSESKKANNIQYKIDYKAKRVRSGYSTFKGSKAA